MNYRGRANRRTGLRDCKRSRSGLNNIFDKLPECFILKSFHLIKRKDINHEEDYQFVDFT